MHTSSWLRPRVLVIKVIFKECKGIYFWEDKCWNYTGYYFPITQSLHLFHVFFITSPYSFVSSYPTRFLVPWYMIHVASLHKLWRICFRLQGHPPSLMAPDAESEVRNLFIPKDTAEEADWLLAPFEFPDLKSRLFPQGLSVSHRNMNYKASSTDTQKCESNLKTREIFSLKPRRCGNEPCLNAACYVDPFQVTQNMPSC